MRYVELNRTDFKRLGVFGEWENPYLTMSPQYEACIAEAFLTFLEKGYVYRGLKPVYWCVTDQTALAEAEVEYEDHSSPSIWVKFAVRAEGTGARLGPDVSALIWTTTPWTLPANRALAFHPEYQYVVAETSAGKLLVAAERLGAVAEELKLEVARVGEPRKGREFEGMTFQHPFLDRQSPGVLADYVTLDQGTGIVHTAPGHGADDFRTGQKYGLEVHAPLDDSGRFTEGLAEYRGKQVFEANPLIIELLKSRGALLGAGKLQHSYPHCWRCQNPVIFRATEQWFVSLEHAGLRTRALEEIAKVRWMPAWGEDRLHEMIATRPDWCISRQRFWGVPLVIFYCEECGKRLEDFAALRNVILWFEREGADAWFSHSAEELLPAGTRCGCGGARWRKETDILDVWFDSGSSHLAVLGAGDMWPADVYLEGPDQFRGWFHSSLLVGVAVRDASPYRKVVTYGWALDHAGRPMSKSLGNVVLPRDVCEKWGADLLRLWVASQDYYSDVRMSDAVMNQLSEAYRKIRNTLRFALGNLADFDPEQDALPAGEMWEIDAWMLERTGELVARCRESYDEFECYRAFHALHDFCVVDLSSFYFDVLKDRLYTFAPRNAGRRSAQTAVFRIASVLTRMLAPMLVFTAEEIWQYLPRGAKPVSSVHTQLFPEPEEFSSGVKPESKGNWERLLSVREEVLKALEPVRNAKTIASALEAKVILHAGEGLRPLLQEYAAQLPAFFIVSQVEVRAAEVADGDGALPLSVEVARADGTKCERCWNFSTHVGENEVYPTVCERCVAALQEIAEASAFQGGAVEQKGATIG